MTRPFSFAIRSTTCFRCSGWRGTADVMREPLHTLAQIFVEIFDSSISPYSIHLQTYTYNELFRAPVLAALGPFRKIFPLEAFLGRLLLFQVISTPRILAPLLQRSRTVKMRQVDASSFAKSRGKEACAQAVT